MAVQDWETTAQSTGLDDIIVCTIGHCRCVNVISYVSAQSLSVCLHIFHLSGTLRYISLCQCVHLPPAGFSFSAILSLCLTLLICLSLFSFFPSNLVVSVCVQKTYFDLHFVLFSQLCINESEIWGENVKEHFEMSNGMSARNIISWNVIPFRKFVYNIFNM